MILLKLHLHNFRNYENEVITFAPHINIICGDNAQGKTNLLEAIFLLSTGRSFRTNNLKELILDGKNFFSIEAEIIIDQVSQTLKIYFDGVNKKILHNSNNLPSLTSLLGIMPSVIHAPTDIELISGTPSIRRRFLNIHIAQKDPLYVHHLSRYTRALKQRNTLLKNRNITSIEIWENEMAKSASYITYKRDVMTSMLNSNINNIMDYLTDKKENVFLKYCPALLFEKDIKKTYEKYLEQLKKSRNKDLLLKSTQHGPHRDDLAFFINSKPAKSFASEGQKRCLISSLKLTEYHLLTSTMQTSALMNIDDIGIHLDSKRQEKLKNYVKSLNQVFITMPSIQNTWIDEKINIIKIQNGLLLAST